MSNENELLEPLATEAGQLAIARAINNLSSLEYAVRAERAATTAILKADEASNSADDASDSATEARNWATKTDGYVAQETITIPPEQEGDEPTTETIDLYSARYYAALAQDIYNNLQFDSVPTENSTNLISSGAVYTALNGKADKSDTYTKTEVDTALNAKADLSTTYTKTEVDTALGNVQSTLTFDNVPTANSDNPVKSSGIKTALDGKQDNLTFDSTPTANSNNPVASGGIYTALQNVNIDIDDEITEDSDNPVTSAAIYEALLNLPSGSEISGDVIYDVLSLPDYVNSLDLLSGYTPTTTIREVTVSKDGVARIYGECSTTGYTIMIYVNGIMIGRCSAYARMTMDKHIIVKSGDIIGVKVDGGSNWRNVSITFYPFVPKILSEQMYSNVLYENSSGVNSGTITLNDNFDNYDFISVEVWDGNNGNAKNQCYYSREFLQQCEENDNFIISTRYHESQVYYKLINLNTITFGGLGGSCKIYKIIGHKMSKGGYSGIVSDARMTVKSGVVELSDVLATYGNSDESVIFDSPMLDTNYVVSVSREFGGTGWVAVEYKISNKTVNGFTLTINNLYNYATSEKPKFSWIAIRPNSYTREGMVEDVLFSNASGVNSGTINLSGNISDYDLIDIQVIDGTSEYHHHTYSSSTLLEYTQSNNKRFLIDGYNENYIDFYVSDSSLTYSGNGRNMKVTKITGIKFGRYVSGVAVDTTVTQGSNSVVTSGAVYDALQNYTPSGGGSGGSITVDTTITENSQNPVTSAAIYSALLNIPSGSGSTDVFYLSTYGNNPTFTCNSGYYFNESKDIVAQTDSWGYRYKITKKNATPSICGIANINGKVQGVAISLFEDGVIMQRWGLANGVLYDESGINGHFIDNGNVWYYSVCSSTLNYSPSGMNTLGNPLINGGNLYTSNIDAVQQLFIDAAPIVLNPNIYREDLFNPNNFAISSGSVISDDLLKGLIVHFRPIKINGETYIPVKLNNNIYYYENPNNIIEINRSSWVMTITAKSSGGSSITVDSTITQSGTNPVEGGAIYTALGDKADKSTTYTKTEVDTALGSKQGTLTFDTTPTLNSTNPVTSGGVYTALQNLPTGTGDVTTNTDQNITGTKTFVGSKKVGFKLSAANDKLGFTLFGNTGTERGYLEFNPTNTVDGVAGLMTLGNYATSAAGLTQVGFRRYSNISGLSGAYNLLMPMVADARTPFSLTTSYQNFYLPLGFTYGTTTVRTAKSGVVDLSPLLASLEARIAALEGN